MKPFKKDSSSPSWKADPTYLMRVGPAGQERPAVRVDEHSYLDVSDLTVDFDEAFLAAGGARQLADEVRARRSRQRGNTATMIFGPYFLVHYLSQFMVLEPGDLINAGTPPGVGMGFTPPVWLKPGDVIQLGIDKLGAQRQRVRAAP